MAQAPPTPESVLSKYGIPLTQQGLQAALKDRRPEVRGLAASELGNLRETASASLIEAAMAKEKNPNARFNMATALLRLGSEKGNIELERVCLDESGPMDHRLATAERLTDAGDFSCLPLLISILRESTDAGFKSSALLAISRIRPAPPSKYREIHDALLTNLQDPNSAVRIYAAEAIAGTKEKAAAPGLRAAIAAEQDASSREKMTSSLEALEGNP
jgi:HEAT repeat protein